MLGVQVVKNLGVFFCIVCTDEWEWKISIFFLALLFLHKTDCQTSYTSIKPFLSSFPKRRFVCVDKPFFGTLSRGFFGILRWLLDK